MMQIKSGLDSVADREKWAQRGASFLAKVKATKMVWFPPKPVESGRAASASARKMTTGAGRKSTATAKKTTKRPASRSTTVVKKKAERAKKGS